MRCTGFRSWDEEGYASLTEDIQENSDDFITHTDEGVRVVAALHKGFASDPDYFWDMTLMIGYEDAGHFSVVLEPDVARGLATMLLRAADMIDAKRAS
jgi:hypothetical protein